MDRDKWKLIEYYIKSNKNFLTLHQIDSFNTFIDQQLPKTLRQFSPISLDYQDLNITKLSDDVNIKYNQKLNIYLGADLKLIDHKHVVINDGSKFFISKPVIEEGVGEGVRFKPVYPNECRLKNLTYSAMFYIDIIFEYYKIDKDGNTISLDEYIKLENGEIKPGSKYRKIKTKGKIRIRYP